MIVPLESRKIFRWSSSINTTITSSACTALAKLSRSNSPPAESGSLTLFRIPLVGLAEEGTPGRMKLNARTRMYKNQIE